MKKIALLGYGTIGSGVYELIETNKSNINKKLGIEVSIEKILIRNMKKYEKLDHSNLFTTNFEDIKNLNPDIVIEVMGGLSPSNEYVRYFLKKGIHIITANKDMIAEYFEEFHNLSKENNAHLKYEASVGGGIPIIKAIKESLIGNNFDSINAVINGTTNFILTKMYNDNMDYMTALKLAQDMGFAESNPSSDVKGYDAVRKLAIMSSLAYKKIINWSTLPTEGITNIGSDDIEIAKSVDCKVKLLAISKYHNNNFYGGVRPAFVKEKSPFANIDNEFNGVSLNGNAVGTVNFYGKGAGKFPTASAVIGNLYDILANEKNIQSFSFGNGYISHNIYPQNTNWLIKVSGSNLEEILKLINLTFESIKTENIKENFNSVTAIVKEVNEDFLIKKLNLLLSSPNVEKIKHFIIFE